VKHMLLRKAHASPTPLAGRQRCGYTRGGGGAGAAGGARLLRAGLAPLVLLNMALSGILQARPLFPHLIMKSY